ncbi:MAG: Sensor protein CitS [Pelotomaculum sp. PtaB.Bin104]|nr:MAG: Sensor protein CitS [Pelotomaculum sp. PtaB.Bin104]
MLVGQIIPFILEYIHHGIIAIDKSGVVIICNQAAKKMLKFDEPVLGRPITSLIAETKLLDVVDTGRSEYGKRFIFNDKTFVVNRTPILDQDFNKKYSTNKIIAPKMLQIFLDYHWPGNIN